MPANPTHDFHALYFLAVGPAPLYHGLGVPNAAYVPPHVPQLRLNLPGNVKKR